LELTHCYLNRDLKGKDATEAAAGDASDLSKLRRENEILTREVDRLRLVRLKALIQYANIDLHLCA
jgi:hypothetical protein